MENGLLSQTVVIFISCLAKWGIFIDYFYFVMAHRNVTGGGGGRGELKGKQETGVGSNVRMNVEQ